MFWVLFANHRQAVPSQWVSCLNKIENKQCVLDFCWPSYDVGMRQRRVFRFSSQAATCPPATFHLSTCPPATCHLSTFHLSTSPPVHHTRSVYFVEHQTEKLWIPIYIVFGLSWPRIKSETTDSVTNALLTRPLIGCYTFELGAKVSRLNFNHLK